MVFRSMKKGLAAILLSGAVTLGAGEFSNNAFAAEDKKPEPSVHKKVEKEKSNNDGKVQFIPKPVKPEEIVRPVRPEELHGPVRPEEINRSVSYKGVSRRTQHHSEERKRNIKKWTEPKIPYSNLPEDARISDIKREFETNGYGEGYLYDAKHLTNSRARQVLENSGLLYSLMCYHRIAYLKTSFWYAGPKKNELRVTKDGRKILGLVTNEPVGKLAIIDKYLTNRRGEREFWFLDDEKAKIDFNVKEKFKNSSITIILTDGQYFTRREDYTVRIEDDELTRKKDRIIYSFSKNKKDFPNSGILRIYVDGKIRGISPFLFLNKKGSERARKMISSAELRRKMNALFKMSKTYRFNEGEKSLSDYVSQYDNCFSANRLENGDVEFRSHLTDRRKQILYFRIIDSNGKSVYSARPNLIDKKDWVRTYDFDTSKLDNGNYKGIFTLVNPKKKTSFDFEKRIVVERK